MTAPPEIAELLDALRADAQGVLVPVAAQPGARRPGLLGVRAGALRLAVSAPPEDGRANAALAVLLADTLALPRRAVSCASGATSRRKLFRVEGLPLAELRERLARALESCR